MLDLQTPETRAYYAAVMEAEQADREFSEQFAALPDNSSGYTAADYALWSIAGYAETAERLVRTMPVWES